jgi:hypothetical protein
MDGILRREILAVPRDLVGAAIGLIGVVVIVFGPGSRGVTESHGPVGVPVTSARLRVQCGR